ncbi:FecR family protein [Psychrobium sp. nBUS_13]|uniref:FecR family protein n=1 Tax=Psychrobium sp. nBUS_13 TaxID=3395319 RepID=UPI003EC13F2D
MNNVSQFVRKEDIQAQASLWISKLERGLSDEEMQELTRWIHRHEENHRQLLQMAAFWDNLSVLNELSALFPLDSMSVQEPRHKKRFAIAASISAMLVTSALMLTQQSWLPATMGMAGYQAQSFTTNVGQYDTLTLSDGSTVVLNTASKLIIDFTPEHRKLILESGEANFDVAKDPSRPFTVHVGDNTFTALGTVFNVQKNSEQAMELVVTEGRVLVAQGDETLEDLAKAISTNVGTTGNATIVASGQKAQIAPNVRAPIVQLPTQAIEKDLAWQQGMIIFEGESLTKALDEVSRYTATEFEIVDSSIADIKIAGFFKAGDIDGLMDSLHSNFNIQATYASPNTVLLSATQP